jgi:putative tributyrin esterase
LCFIFLILCCIAATASGQNDSARATFIEDSVFSPALKRNVAFRAITPGNLNPAHPRPALLLLHGYGGNHTSWSSSIDLVSIVDTLQLVILMPNGDDSWYVNSAADSNDRYEDALISDLLPALVQRFGLDTASMGVAGFSMGGFGALSLGLRHPRVFAVAGAFSASLDVPLRIPELERNNRGYLRESLERAFGTDTTRWRACDPVTTLLTLDSATIPYLYLVTGIQDEFTARISLYHDFSDFLRNRNIAYEYHETPGHHNWAFCRQEIGPFIRRMLEILAARPPH